MPVSQSLKVRPVLLKNASIVSKKNICLVSDANVHGLLSLDDVHKVVIASKKLNLTLNWDKLLQATISKGLFYISEPKKKSFQDNEVSNKGSVDEEETNNSEDQEAEDAISDVTTEIVKEFLQSKDSVTEEDVTESLDNKVTPSILDREVEEYATERDDSGADQNDQETTESLQKFEETEENLAEDTTQKVEFETISPNLIPEEPIPVTEIEFETTSVNSELVEPELEKEDPITVPGLNFEPEVSPSVEDPEIEKEESTTISVPTFEAEKLQTELENPTTVSEMELETVSSNLIPEEPATVPVFEFETPSPNPVPEEPKLAEEDPTTVSEVDSENTSPNSESETNPKAKEPESNNEDSTTVSGSEFEIESLEPEITSDEATTEKYHPGIGLRGDESDLTNEETVDEKEAALRQAIEDGSNHRLVRDNEFVHQKPKKICKEDDYNVDPHDSSIFYRCIPIDDTFLAYRFHCPPGLTFNTEFKHCM